MTETTDYNIKAVKEYINEISDQFVTGIVTEHSYRGFLQGLLKEILTDCNVINEPSRISCGAPDYVITKGFGSSAIPIAYIEAKDVGDNDLDGQREKNGHKEQFDRYKKSLDCIIFTDYLDFHLYEKEKFITSIQIGEIKGNKIVLRKDNISKFLELIKHLVKVEPQKIKTPKELARMMARKAKLLASTIYTTLEKESEEDGALSGQWRVFKEHLINDLSKESFSDIYAQTIVYGMFAARLYDKTPATFSRMEAAELIPQTNPFLRKIFQKIATFDVNESFVWILDDMVEAFKVTDTKQIMENFGEKKGAKDPLTYFYEDFLKEYNPDLIKEYGVFYTPLPIVKFIVNSVDELLKSRWKLHRGLADTSTVQVKQSNAFYVDNRTVDKKRLELKKYPKVQVLDPATGTGTFLAEVVNKIWENTTDNRGAWQNYVEEHLLPRLNGFEIMMAPYAIAHIKLDINLSQKNFVPQKDQRLKIFLTNSLENRKQKTEPLFDEWLATEVKEANRIKQNSPVMVMIGNPPYNNSSSNNGDWIIDEIKEYKKNLGEKKLNLNDDYIKFIRLGQYYIEKNGEGILAYITNNSFISGITHRQMRKSLMETFDEIYILNLHGYAYAQKNLLSGQKDENVFDIRQGVSINIFIKNGRNGIDKTTKKRLAKVFYFDLYGTRTAKFDFLAQSSFEQIPWIELKPLAPYHFFIPKNLSEIEHYEKGFKIDDLMKVNNSGVGTDRDSLFYDTDKERLKKRMEYLLSEEPLDDSFVERYHIKDSSSYKITDKIKNQAFDSSKIIEASFKVLDNRYLYYDENIISRPAYKVMRHMNKENIALVTSRQCFDEWKHVFCTNLIGDRNLIASSAKFGIGEIFPLYLYHKDDLLTKRNDELVKGVDSDYEKIPNLDHVIWEKINKKINTDTSPEEIFDYIYGILHTPKYRHDFEEFLQIDFPHIPYPKNKEFFDKIKAIGSKLRKLHLMEDIPLPQASFSINGSNVISKIKFEKEIPNQAEDKTYGKVYINTTQYFANVPEIAWNFYIGGYQPAQKWLKERKDHKLSYDDIEHYEKIITILTETNHLMQELDAIS